MKKIIFLHSWLDTGGAENLRLSLLRNIDKTRFNVKVCCIGRKGTVARKIEKLGYIVDELGENPNSKNICVAYRLFRYLKKERPDILHCSLFNSNFHGRIAGLLCRIPHLITEEHGEHRQYVGIKFLPYIISDFFLSSVSDFIICCSERLKDELIKKERLPRSKVVSIENCLDIGAYKIKIERDTLREKHGISDEIVFITAASLKAGKGHDYLIEVFRELKEDGYRFKCFFAGDGPLKESLKLKVKGLKLEEQIIFLGNIDNIADYLNASDVFVFPSFSEGLSVALMEAMFIGLPSIVTNVGSNPDLVNTGFNGTVVLPGDKRGLKNALVFYLQNKYIIREYGTSAKAIIEKRYSFIDRYLRQYYELWDKCSKNNR